MINSPKLFHFHDFWRIKWSLGVFTLKSKDKNYSWIEFQSFKVLKLNDFSKIVF